MKSILIFGAGNMGGVLAKGLCSSSRKYNVQVYDLHFEKSENVAQLTKAHAIRNLSEVTQPFDVLILCVKPQDLNKVSKNLKNIVGPNSVVVSILAGVKISSIEESLGHSGAIVRTMPNICALVGEAATALCDNQKLSENLKVEISEIFETIGTADWIKEELLDAVTGLSGSGPAYLYLVIEAMTLGGVKMGIPQRIAAKLAAQTMLGSAKMVLSSGTHPAVLRDQVTTPGGTTIHALHELEERGLRAMLMEAVKIATERSVALGKKDNI